MLRNLTNKTQVTQLFSPASVTADVNTSSIDLKHYRSFAFIANVGAFAFTGVNKIALKIQESTDNVVFTDAPLTSYEGGAIKELADTADQNKAHLIGYKGEKQYVRMALDVSGTVAANVGVTGLSTDLELNPAV